MRSFFTFITIFFLPFMAMAQEEEVKTMSAIDQLKIETWQMNSDVAEYLIYDSHNFIRWERFTDSVMAGATSLHSSFCYSYIKSKFGKDESCGSWYDFPSDVRDFLLSPTFAKFLLNVDNGRITQKLIDSMGAGRAEMILSQTKQVYIKDFDTNHGLNYVAWGDHLCHIRFAHPDAKVNRGKTYEECQDDSFTQYLKENYCADNVSDQCVANSGWLYGFLVRRYFDGGIEAAQNWQKLLRQAATQAGVEVTDPS